MTVAITRIQRGTNAQLVATATRLYPLDGDVLDMTPGPQRGFWRIFEPAHLDCLGAHVDFRDTGQEAATYDHVVFDPPYVAKGGHATSTLGSMNERYGMLHVERSPMEQWQGQILPGVVEAHRLLRPRGLLWWKLQDYVTSGRVWWFTKLALHALDARGFDLVDEFILDGRPGPQPKRNADGTERRQAHARNAHSALMIARKRRATR